ncbi:helix-turn-helix domain-containing protein [Micromonospora sp. CPCC 205554]|uniref:helix-turn-helix domain-containing protein n=2 Tax=unclassified Micromonospora TaxID=2617518 RepID=UPI002FF3D472
MSVRVMSWVWDHSPVGGTQRLVLLAIADCADDTGENAWPSVATLARKVRLDERTVQRVIRRLVDGGHLTVSASAGGRASNRYAVIMRAGDADASPVADATPGDVSRFGAVADCHPGDLPPRHSATAGVALDATAGVAQLCHPNVLERPRTIRARERRRAGGPAAPARGVPRAPAPPPQRCPDHPGQYAGHCGPCRSERIAPVEPGR